MSIWILLSVIFVQHCAAQFGGRQFGGNSGFYYPNQYSQPSYQQRPQVYTRPQQNFPQRLNERISEKKCREYTWKGPVVSVASLSLGGDVQDINVENCEPSIGLVVGGENAKKGDFPHMAAIGYPTAFGDGKVEYKCGGSLISERFVLTAAHCKKANRADPTKVRLGDLRLNSYDQDLPQIDIPVLRFIAHERYNSRTKINDIGLVQMDRSVQFSKFLRPACLATPNSPSKNKAVASGWGVTEIGGRTGADHLQKVELSIFDVQRCKDIYGDYGRTIDNNQICAGELIGAKDTCQGDSGGPLQVTMDSNKCMSVILGITSYGSRYCGSNQPGIYTKVSAYLDWIEQKVWGQN